MERHGLVEVTSQESPVFSDEHKNALVRQTTLYLESKRIYIDKASFDRGADVIVDALKRGLSLAGVDLAHAGRSITKYIKSGLEERDSIKTGVGEVIKKTYDLGSGYVGELALPQELIRRAEEEADSFNLNGNVAVSERLHRLAKIRQQSLGEISDKVIGYLPEVLFANAKEKLKSNDEKSRLIKNAIVSTVFSKKINPIISIDELWSNFKSYQQNTGNYFNEQNFFDITKKLNLDTDQSEYLKDLFYQLRGNFESKKADTFNAGDKDKFYLKFSRELLLLHPALEEEQIILDYDKRDGFTQSVWDNGVCHEIGGFKVPSKGILIAALRQAEAAGSIAKVNRIKEAIRSWSNLDVDKVKFPKKIWEVQMQNDNDNKVIKSLRAIGGEKKDPRDDIEEILTKKRKEFGQASFIYKVTQRQVNLSRERLAEAEKLLALAKEGGEQRFQLPREYHLLLLSRKILSYSTSLTSLSSNIDKNGKVLRDQLGGYNEGRFIQEGITTVAPQVYNSEYFLKYAVAFERMYEIVMKSGDRHIFKKVSVENQKGFSDFLVRYIKLLKNESFRKHYGFARVTKWDRNVFLNLATRKPEDKKVLNMVSKIILRTLRPKIKMMEKQYLAIERAKENREEVKKKKELISSGGEISYGEDVYRNIEWGENFHREAEISELGSDLNENLAGEALDFTKLHVQRFSRYLPQIIDKEGFRQGIVKSLPDLMENIAIRQQWIQAEKENNPENYEKSKAYIWRVADLNATKDALGQAHYFLEQLDSKYFRFDIAGGMKTRRYLDLISKKIILLNRLKSLPKLREDFERMGREVEKLEIELKLFETIKRKAETLQKLKDLKANDPVKNHIGRMKDLELAVKV